MGLAHGGVPPSFVTWKTGVSDVLNFIVQRKGGSVTSLTPEGATTTLSVDWDPEEKMTGEESYPVIGSLLSKRKFDDICRDCFMGLYAYADCVDKNVRGREALIEIPTVLAIGAIRVWDKFGKGCYGFDYNPPYEIHSWLVPKKYPRAVIDFSLPGVILRALKFVDEEGPIVEGRKPTYLAGPPPQWIQYHPVEIHHGENIETPATRRYA